MPEYATSNHALFTDVFCSPEVIHVPCNILGYHRVWPFRFVAILVFGLFGLWPFRPVAVLVCDRSGLWSFRFVAVSVSGRVGLWPFRLAWQPPSALQSGLPAWRPQKSHYCINDHYSNVTWEPCLLESLTIRLLGQQFVHANFKEIIKLGSIKAPDYWPFWGDSPMAGGFPSQRVNNAELAFFPNLLIWVIEHFQTSHITPQKNCICFRLNIESIHFR